MTVTMLPGAEALSEWFSRVNGGIAGCGQAGVLVIEHILQGTPISAAELTAAIQQGVASGETVDKQGATTLQNLQWLAAQNGLRTTIIPGSQAVATAQADAGRIPVEIGLSNARALGGSDAGVLGHYVTVVGWDSGTRKFVVADPNTPQATTGGFVEYSPKQMQAAQPFGALVPSQPTAAGGTGTPTGTATDAYTFGNPLDVAGAITSSVNSLEASATSALKRVGIFVLGGILLAVGLVMIFGKPALDLASSALPSGGTQPATTGAALSGNQAAKASTAARAEGAAVEAAEVA